MKTRNITKSKYEDNENYIRSNSNINKRKGKSYGTESKNEYDEILADHYKNYCGDYSIQMKHLD